MQAEQKEQQIQHDEAIASLKAYQLKEQKRVAAADAARMAEREKQRKKERKRKKRKKKAELLNAFMKQSENANQKCVKMMSLFAQQGQEGNKNGMNMMMFAEAMRPQSSNMTHMRAILADSESESD